MAEWCSVVMRSMSVVDGWTEDEQSRFAAALREAGFAQVREWTDGLEIVDVHFACGDQQIVVSDEPFAGTNMTGEEAVLRRLLDLAGLQRVKLHPARLHK